MRNATCSPPKISVLVVTLNRAELLKNCLDSLLVQTRMPEEVIVVDNGSTDNTPEVVAGYRVRFPTFRCVTERRRRNIATARNTGLRYCAGDVIALTDDDCVCDKMWVENILKFHNMYPRVMAIGGKAIPALKNNFFHRVSQIIWDDNDIIENTPADSSFLRRYFRREDKPFEAVHLRGCNISYKKDIFKKFRFDERLINCDDLSLHLSLCREGRKLLYIPGITVKHYHRAAFAALAKQYFIYGRGYAQMYFFNRHFDVNVPAGIRKTVFFILSPFLIVAASMVKHREEFQLPFRALGEFFVVLVTRLIFKTGVLYEIVFKQRLPSRPVYRGQESAPMSGG